MGYIRPSSQTPTLRMLSLAGPQASYVQLGLLLRRPATQQIDQQTCEPLVTARHSPELAQ